MTTLKNMLRNWISALPTEWQVSIAKFFFGLSYAIDNRRLPVSKITANQPQEGAKTTFVMCGEMPQYKDWIYRFFGEQKKPFYTGKRNIFQIWSRKGDLSQADVLLCPLNPLFSSYFEKKGWYVVPVYLSGVIDLSEPIEDLLSSKSAKVDLRAIKKQNFTFRIVTDEESIIQFYETMLVPTVKKQHGDNAHIGELDAILELAKRGFLHAIDLDGKWVAGHLMVEDEPKSLRSANVAWLFGDPEIRKTRVYSASIIELINWGKEKGYETLNLGSVSPFANDGGLEFKLKFGCNMIPPEFCVRAGSIEGGKSRIGVFFNLSTIAGQTALGRIPTLRLDGESIGVIGYNSKVLSSFDRLQKHGMKWIDLAEADGVYKGG